MHYAQIKLEIEKIVPHAVHCKTLKEPAGECNCSHAKVSEDLYQLILAILKQKR